MIKDYRELTFTDNFIFCCVLRDNPDLCKRILEVVLDARIRGVVRINTEDAIKNSVEGRGVRLDIYAEDEDRILYNIEMQTTDQKNLPLRSRYYQGMMDTESLLKGEDYDELKESIIIFLCRFDPFKKGIPWYTVKRTCIEDSNVFIDDGALVKVFNCTAYEKVANGSLQAFLRYIQNNRAESDFTRRISDMVEAQKRLEATKKVYFTWSLHDHDVRKHGREEGRKEGIRIGEKKGQSEKAIETARKMLARNYPVNDIADITGLSVKKIEELATKVG